MTKLSKNLGLLGFWKSRQTLKSKVKKAKTRFEEKSFAESYSSINRIAESCKIILPIISSCTAITTGAVILNMFIGWLPLCFLLSGGIFVGLEAIKAIILDKSFENYYKGSNLSFLIVFAFLLAGISGFSSVHGIIELEKIQNNSEDVLFGQYQLKTDSVKQYHSELIKSAKTAKNGYFKANSYKGKIWSESGFKEKQYQLLTDRVLDLEKKKEQELEEVKKEQFKAISNSEIGSQGKLTMALVFVIFIEISILLANWFPVYFDFKVKDESEIIEEMTGQKLLITPEQIAGFVGQMLVGNNFQYLSGINQSSPLILNQNGQLGFRQNQETDNKSPGNGNTYKDLEEAVKAGVVDIRYLTKTFHVNVQTARKYLKKYSPKQD